MGNGPLYVATCQKGPLALNSGHVFHLKERGNTFFPKRRYTCTKLHGAMCLHGISFNRSDWHKYVLYTFALNIAYQSDSSQWMQVAQQSSLFHFGMSRGPRVLLQLIEIFLYRTSASSFKLFYSALRHTSHITNTLSTSSCCSCFFFLSGATAQRGPGPRHSRGFCITHSDTPQSVALLWMKDRPVA